MSDPKSFAEMVAIAEAKIDAYDPDAIASETPPRTLRFEPLPSPAGGEDGADGATCFRAWIIPDAWSHAERMSMRLLAFVLAVLVTVNAAFIITRGASVLLGVGAVIMWLVSGGVALHLRTLRARTEFIVDGDGFTAIRHFAWRAIGERAEPGGRGMMSERFERRELRAIAVIISDMATDDDETSFDLLVTRMTEQGHRLRDSVVRSRRREEVEWLAARLRLAMAVPMHLPDSERFEPAPKWPKSVRRKIAEGKSKNWEY